MSKSLWVVIVVVTGAILIAGAVILIRPGDDQRGSESKESIDKSETYTEEQVASHSSREDCWTIIRGEVYDLTDYIARHPGGNEIVRACGTDATSLFENRRTSEGDTAGSGTPHGGAARSELSRLRIGSVN